jgi:hypothetical protein
MQRCRIIPSMQEAGSPAILPRVNFPTDSTLGAQQSGAPPKLQASLARPVLRPPRTLASRRGTFFAAVNLSSRRPCLRSAAGRGS